MLSPNPRYLAFNPLGDGCLASIPASIAANPDVLDFEKSLGSILAKRADAADLICNREGGVPVGKLFPEFFLPVADQVGGSCPVDKNAAERFLEIKDGGGDVGVSGDGAAMSRMRVGTSIAGRVESDTAKGRGF
ncbi:hypothetical protein ACJRO7_027934 [Eucalyptus globulus]|uniref:Uncharacterized protein n=1 Tax=Eucalyptus globulus TaxID=34317 RepID=A0ABD3JYQ6_EUCGL